MFIAFWDIDGTILTNSHLDVNLHVQAIQRFATTLPENFDKLVVRDGKTDLRVIREYLSQVSPSENPIIDEHEVLKALNELSIQIYTPGTRELLPYIPEAMAAVKQQGGFNALLTGNSLERSRAKFTAAEFDAPIDWELSVFGDQTDNRNDLGPIAKQKADELHVKAMVIGDTPFDIAAGKAGGLLTLAVATGIFSSEQLQEHEPDLTLEDLHVSFSGFNAFLKQLS